MLLVSRYTHYGRECSLLITKFSGIYEGGENYDVADSNLWIQNYAPYIPVGTKPDDLSVDGGIGPVDQADGGVEALLDITIAYELIYPQAISLFSVDDPYYSTDPTAYGFMDTTLDALDGVSISPLTSWNLLTII